MRACIHRGAREVGGSCVEVEHDGARLVLDAGLAMALDDAGAVTAEVRWAWEQAT